MGKALRKESAAVEQGAYQGKRGGTARRLSRKEQREMEKSMAKKTAYLGMMISLAFVFSYLESLIPITAGIPGIKLGLANLVAIVALYTIGVKEACAVSLIRIILTGFTFGTPASMVYSLAGGALSILAMIAARKINLFSAAGVSVLGGVFHNVGQIVIAMLVVENAKLLYYLPVLILSGTIAGAVIGILAGILIKRLEKLLREG